MREPGTWGGQDSGVTFGLSLVQRCAADCPETQLPKFHEAYVTKTISISNSMNWVEGGVTSKTFQNRIVDDHFHHLSLNTYGG